MRKNKDLVLSGLKTIIENGFKTAQNRFNVIMERFPKNMEKPDIILPIDFIMLANNCLKLLSLNDEEREDIIIKTFVDALQKHLNK